MIEGTKCRVWRDQLSPFCQENWMSPLWPISLEVFKNYLSIIVLSMFNVFASIGLIGRVLFMSKRKSVKGPDANIYDNLYLGRGIPDPQPNWNKDNKNKRSPFGASWAHPSY